MALTRITQGRMARHGIGWQAAAFVVAALILMPVLALAVFAAQGSPGLWAHLIRNVLPSAASQTVILLAGFFGRAVAPRALGRPYSKER